MDFGTLLQMLDATLRLATPLLLACLAGLFSERAGIFDIGLEGKMLAAAFLSAAVAAVSGSVWLGLFAGIFANKFDQMAAITNFIVTPLAFLSGTFYSVEALPPLLNRLTHLNPVFYLIDGLRYGMIGVSDSSPWLGMAVCTFATLVIGAITWLMLRTGYRLKA